MFELYKARGVLWWDVYRVADDGYNVAFSAGRPPEGKALIRWGTKPRTEVAGFIVRMAGVDQAYLATVREALVALPQGESLTAHCTPAGELVRAAGAIVDGRRVAVDLKPRPAASGFTPDRAWVTTTLEQFYGPDRVLPGGRVSFRIGVRGFYRMPNGSIGWESTLDSIVQRAARMMEIPVKREQVDGVAVLTLELDHINVSERRVLLDGAARRVACVEPWAPELPEVDPFAISYSNFYFAWLDRPGQVFFHPTQGHWHD